MALIAHRFRSIEADGPWTSPPFPPAERRHVVQGVIGGHIMGRPRWAEDLDGNFIYGLDAKGKEMKSVPSASTAGTRHHATKKSPAQLDREIAEALAPHQGRWDDGPGAWQRGYEFAQEAALHETRAEQREILQRVATGARSAYDHGFVAGYQDMLGAPRSSKGGR